MMCENEKIKRKKREYIKVRHQEVWEILCEKYCKNKCFDWTADDLMHHRLKTPDPCRILHACSITHLIVGERIRVDEESANVS